ncbi:Homeobox domain-containing protein [Balamuthia mandrillaris]
MMSAERLCTSPPPLFIQPIPQELGPSFPSFPMFHPKPEVPILAPPRPITPLITDYNNNWIEEARKLQHLSFRPIQEQEQQQRKSEEDNNDLQQLADAVRTEKEQEDQDDDQGEQNHGTPRQMSSSPHEREALDPPTPMVASSFSFVPASSCLPSASSILSHLSSPSSSSSAILPALLYNNNNNPFSISCGSIPTPSTSYLSACSSSSSSSSSTLRPSWNKHTTHATHTARRKRATTHQRKILEDAFAEDPLPSPKKKERIARQVGLSEKRVQIWFQNRRAQQRREQRTRVLQQQQQQQTSDHLVP